MVDDVALQNLILLKGYNNYYNRKYKKEGNNVSDYNYYINFTLQNSNFNPNDGVDTEHIFHGTDVEKSDYLLVADNLGNIDSRWFIIETTRNASYQYTMRLHRDLAADFKTDIDGSIGFIEKATLNDENDSAIFNNENMTFNQIKTSEKLLKDRTGTAWIIGYMAKNTEETTINLTSPLTVADIFNELPSTTFKVYRHDLGCINTIKARTTGTPVQYLDYTWSQGIKGGIYPGLSTGAKAIIIEGSTDILKHLAESPNNFALTNYVVGQNNMVYSTNADFNKVNNLVGKIIKVDNKFYNVELVNISKNKHITYTDAGEYLNAMAAVATDFSDISSSACSSFIYYDEYTFRFSEVRNGTYTLTIPTTRKHLQDAPYDMFCIPIEGNVIVSNLAGFIVYPEFSVNIAQQIITELSDFCYDIQLVPYCPLLESELDVDEPTVIHSEYWLSPIGTEDIDYSVIYDNSPEPFASGAIFWCSKSRGTFDINESIEIENYKIQSNTDNWRLCSPNYNGIFEFNAAKNGGVDKFNVDWDYKPFNPYIHVNPNFGRLYGSDFNDSRGLICGGDFSLSRVNDAWADYQLRNKNYQLAFDRNIESMELNNKWNLAGDIVNAATGAFAAGVTGATFGGTVGAIAGSVLSAGAGALDVIKNQQLRNDTLDLTKDQFGYQLGNIQALPNGISKVSAFTNNNKLFPVLEYYTCTDEEKQALQDKITYNGMTIMRIGTIGDYINNGGYFKCKLIRCDTIQDDFHLLMAISEELDKGVYI